MKVQFSHIKYIGQFILLAFILLIPKVHFSQKFTATSTQNLNFGSFYPTGSGGSIIVSTTGARSLLTGNIVLLSSGTPPSNAIFQITGKGNANYITNININNTILSRIGGGGSLSLNSFTFYPPPLLNIKNRTVYLNVGATLTIGSITANPPGAYTGPFYVNFIYN